MGFSIVMLARLPEGTIFLKLPLPMPGLGSHGQTLLASRHLVDPGGMVKHLTFFTVELCRRISYTCGPKYQL